jgi:hypothetical protein
MTATDTAVPTLPNWLTAHESSMDKTRFPVTKEHLEMERLTFEAVFETVLDRIVEGQPILSYLKEDPREVDYPRFLRWIRKDPERVARYEEAQEIGTEALLEKMDEIAEGTQSPEDIERSKLRLAQYKFKVQAWNKRRYGGEKEQATSFGMGGVTINISQVESPYEKVINPKVIDG